jgi:hypothetical protein
MGLRFNIERIAPDDYDSDKKAMRVYPEKPEKQGEDLINFVLTSGFTVTRHEHTGDFHARKARGPKRRCAQGYRSVGLAASADRGDYGNPDAGWEASAPRLIDILIDGLRRKGR